MIKIYMVESGEYDERRVVGLFSTEEKAETFMRTHPVSRYRAYQEIETWVLDEPEQDIT